MPDADATVVIEVPPLEFEVTLRNEVEFPRQPLGRSNQRRYIADVRLRGEKEVTFSTAKCSTPVAASLLADFWVNRHGGRVVNRPNDQLHSRPFERMTMGDVEICLRHANLGRPRVVELAFWAKARELGYTDTPNLEGTVPE